MVEKSCHNSHKELSFNIGGYKVTLHRSESAYTEDERKNQLSLYVNTICELGKKYMDDSTTTMQNKCA